MLAFVVLPLLDNVIQMAMVMMGVGLTPAIMLTVQRVLNRKFYIQENERSYEVQDTKMFILRLSLDIFALLCQIVGLITWPIYVLLKDKDHEHLAWSVPLSLILISLGVLGKLCRSCPVQREENAEFGTYSARTQAHPPRLWRQAASDHQFLEDGGRLLNDHGFCANS